MCFLLLVIHPYFFCLFIPRGNLIFRTIIRFFETFFFFIFFGPNLIKKIEVSVEVLKDLGYETGEVFCKYYKTVFVAV